MKRAVRSQHQVIRLAGLQDSRFNVNGRVGGRVEGLLGDAVGGRVVRTAIEQENGMTVVGGSARHAGILQANTRHLGAGGRIFKHHIIAAHISGATGIGAAVIIAEVLGRTVQNVGQAANLVRILTNIARRKVNEQVKRKGLMKGALRGYDQIIRLTGFKYHGFQQNRRIIGVTRHRRGQAGRTGGVGASVQ